MTEKVLETIREHNMLKEGDKVLVAVSGGADSVGLLTVLCELRDILKIEVFAANLNHNLRGGDSDGDTEYVKYICEKMNVRLFCRSEDIAKMAKEDSIGEEECGRRERYRLFEDAAKELGGAKIATGHHAEDNAETVIFHLIRGSGTRGMGGILYVRENVIRPLLDVKKSDIEEYLRKKGIDWRTDKSNFSLEYARNRIRHVLLPEMEDIFHGAAERISRTAHITADDEDYLQREAERSGAFKNGVIDGKIFSSLHESLKRRIIIKALEEWKVKDIDFKKIKIVADIAEGRTGRSADLGGGVTVRNEYQRTGIVKTKEKRQFVREVSYGENAKISFLNHLIEVKTVDKCEKMSDNNMIAVYDADKLGNFEIRTRADGDYIYLKKSGGRKKLKELFIDEKLPRDERDALLLAAKGSEIIFVPKVRVSERYRPDIDTKRFVILSYIRMKGCE